ncbi:delta-like protein 1 [Dreissena polymorpha]|uniref:Delta-like protein n=1 Tax=Dreissena polymorpha TaxID=45954 RepID=A0A9D4MLM1_DREPO|nr:delta-like protein 1 [Dreissena polymorpha]KAH3877527.1 hypothetical protein DPMN_001400 [Dreissena polymorpha]
MPALLNIVLLIYLLPAVDGTGYIQTKFREFVNINGQRYDGTCCGPAPWLWGSRKKTNCGEPCKHAFVICMGNVTQSSSMSACEYGSKKTESVEGNKITFDDHIGYDENPLKFPFETWPGVVKLKIKINDNSDSEEQLVDRVEYQYNTRDLRREIDAPVHDVTLQGERTRLDVELKVFCAMDFYGPACDLYCKETDDVTGHFRCDPVSGDKICLNGWAGADCLTNIDDCVGHGCALGATCVDGLGYYSCKCPPGRTGHTCQHEVNECSSSPCVNGGRCKDASNGFLCECPPGFAGILCEVELNECRSAPCLNQVID